MTNTINTLTVSSQSFRRQYGVTLNDAARKKQAGKIAAKLSAAENKYLQALNSGDQKKIATTEIEYRKFLKNFEAFRQIMNNAFQIMLQAIRGLSVR